MADSWCPPNTEVHGLASHGQAVRSILISVAGHSFWFTGVRRSVFPREN